MSFFFFVLPSFPQVTSSLKDRRHKKYPKSSSNPHVCECVNLLAVNAHTRKVCVSRSYFKKKEQSEEEEEEEETERRDAFLFETTENARATSCESCTCVLLLFFDLETSFFFSFFRASTFFFPHSQRKRDIQ